MYNVDNILARFIFDKSLSFLQVRRTAIRAWMSSNFRQIHSRTVELAALELLKISIDLQLYLGEML